VRSDGQSVYCGNDEKQRCRKKNRYIIHILLINFETEYFAIMNHNSILRLTVNCSLPTASIRYISFTVSKTYLQFISVKKITFIHTEFSKTL